MKQPRKLTRVEKYAVSAYKLNADEWAHVKDLGEYFQIINKRTGKMMMIDRNRR